MGRDRGRRPSEALIARVSKSRARPSPRFARAAATSSSCGRPRRAPTTNASRSTVPREQTWDRLLRETGAFGIHFEDYPEMQGLELPEWSHLSREIARRASRAPMSACYVSGT